MMKKMTIVLVTLAFCCSLPLLMASCAKKQIRMEESVEPTVAAPAEAAGEADMGYGETEVEFRDTAAEAEAERLAKLEEEKERKLRAAVQVFQSGNIYFDFDRSELKQEARDILIEKADWLLQNTGYSVRVEGHCDERGTNEYNLALGERRANVAVEFLKALGIPGNRLSTLSFGEERPAFSGHNEAAWSKNRRDEFKLIH